MYVTQTVENQEVMWLPTNDDTKTIQYDTKFLKSAPGRYPALKWTVTKIEDSATEGIARFTMAQTQFDPSKDNVELMVADYYDSAIAPEIKELEETPTITDLEIIFSGQPAVRAGGGYKKFTLKTRADGKLVDAIGEVKWDIDFADNDPDKLESSQNDNYFKVKCLNDYSLIGKTFTITATHEQSSTSLIVEVIGL